jgi:hypothetical protein
VAFLDDIGDFLLGATATGTGFSGILGTLFLSDFPDGPDAATAVVESGGTPPETTMAIDYRRFSVLVRGVENSYQATQLRADQIYTLLHCAALSGTIYCYADQSGPLPLGMDEQGRPLFSLNFRTMRHVA